MLVKFCLSRKKEVDFVDIVLLCLVIVTFAIKVYLTKLFCQLEELKLDFNNGR